MSAEFSRRVPLMKLSGQSQEFHLEADAEARAALAKRFDLIEISRLRADLEASRQGMVATVTGKFIADVVQACVVSGEPVPARVEDAVNLRFEEFSDDEDIELEEDALDVLPVENDAIDLGEAVAQSLYLALDPYPRASEEALAKVRSHLITEEEAAAAAEDAKAAASPFAKLKRP